MTDIVALSGWAMPSHVFDTVGKYCDMKSFALPGVESWPGIKEDHPFTNEDLVNAMKVLLPEKPVTLTGWSLGGILAALFATACPERVNKLVLAGCNPCFVATPSWPYGMEKSLYLQFVEGMKNNAKTTLKKFFFLSTEGAENTRSLLRRFSRFINEASLSLSLLYRMLLFLQQDMRALFRKVSCPVTWVFAENDALVPPAIVPEIRRYNPGHQVISSKGCHMFFMEAPERMASIITGK